MSDSIAKNTFQQFGGQRSMIMIGGTPMADGNSLRIKFKAKSINKINVFSVTLDEATDTYDLEFGRVHGDSYKKIKNYTYVYGDQLKDIFESETGLLLSL